MGKKFLLLVLAILGTANLFAQTVKKGDGPIDASYRISVGPKVGMNMGMMNGLQDEYALNPSNGMGFQGGLAANFHFGRRTTKALGGTGLWGVQVEALYSQRTIKTDIEDLKFSCLDLHH